MKKILRLFREAIFVVFIFKNPMVYYRERLHRSRTDSIVLALWRGPRYRLHANTNEIRMVNEIWIMKVYDPLLKWVRDGSVVIDIGANVGIFSIKAGLAAKNVRVFSFEPFSQSFAALRENIQLNGLENNITATHSAVAATKGNLQLFFRPQDPGGVSFYQFGDRRELSSFTVPAITLEEIFSANHIATCDYLKMDCEGAEEQILLQAPKTLFSRIRTITLEWHYNLNHISVTEMEKYLEGLGYRVWYQPTTFTLYAERVG